jgi:hypothetical protein
MCALRVVVFSRIAHPHSFALHQSPRNIIPVVHIALEVVPLHYLAQLQVVDHWIPGARPFGYLYRPSHL